MGIDEIKIIGKCRGVITNIGDNTVVNLLKDRDKPLMTNYLMKIKDRHKITRVAIDMWKPYKDAVYACLSNATVVIDKFHVVRMANSCLDTIRKGIREDLTKAQRRGLMHDRFLLLRRAHNLDPFQQLTLETWTKNFPALGEAYQAKEAFFAIYDAKSLADAKSAYLAWKSGLTSGITDAFKPLTTAMGNWETEVLNYFEHPVTNAYTECLNGLTRVIDRSGRGYSFEALRAKILFSAGAHKKVIPKFERQRTKPQPEYAMNRMMLMTGFDQDAPSNTKTRLQEKNLGTDINTLLRLMDEGKI
jgi:transposase